MALLTWILTAVLAFIFIHIWQKYQKICTRNYWHKLNIPHVPQSTIRDFIESNKKSFQHIKSFDSDTLTYTYLKINQIRICGTSEPGVLFITDSEILQSILTTHFDHFTDRRQLFEPKINPLFTRMVSFLEGQEWKTHRSILTSTFTPSKMKRIHALFQENSQNLVNQIQKSKSMAMGADEGILIHELIGRFTMDTISSTAFGITDNCISNPDAILYNMGKKVQKLTLRTLFTRILAKYVPKVAELLRVSTFDKDALIYFANVVRSVIETRKITHENQRQDFLQILLDCQNECESFTENDVISQAVLFFILGFDTVNSLLGIACVVLACLPKIQEKIHREIDEVFRREIGGKLPSESLSELRYTDAFFSEILRLYPPTTRTERRCTKEFHNEKENVWIPVGTQVVFPIHALHIDPDHWENPHVFNPERFYGTECESRKNNRKCAFLPFGDGPRSCLGKRFAMNQCKTALAALLLNFELRPGTAHGNMSSVIQQRVGIFKVKDGTRLKFLNREKFKI